MKTFKLGGEKYAQASHRVLKHMRTLSAAHAAKFHGAVGLPDPRLRY